MSTKYIKFILGIISYYLLPLTLAATLYFIPKHNLKSLAIELGVWSLNFLLFILFVKPLSVLFPKISLFKIVIGWRRELGVAVFYLGFFHVVGIFMATDLWFYPEEWLYGFTNPTFFGTIALTILFLLYLTSNKFSLIKLGRNWKKLHYFAYPSLLLVLMHKFGLEEDTLIPAFIAFTVFGAFKLFEFRKKALIKERVK